MLKIRFTIEDMASTHVAPTLGLKAESVFALQTLVNGSEQAFAGWRRRIVMHLARTTMVRDLPWYVRNAPDLTALITAPHSNGAQSGLIARAVDDFGQRAIAPHWLHLHKYLEDQSQRQARLLGEGGVKELLGSLHPAVRWNVPTLEIPHSQDVTVSLDGRGLTVVPSVFQMSQPIRVITDGRFRENPVLVFATEPNDAEADEMLRSAEPPDPQIDPLLGRTRAAVLRLLTQPRSTSEIAEDLQISQAGASQHATILRSAGLITTRRTKNSVQHFITPLGRALIKGVTGRQEFRRTA